MKRLLFTALATLAIAVAYFAPHAVSNHSRPETTGARPILVCPEALDLGERALGEVVTRRLTIANRGSAELVIDQVRSSCTCSGLERVGAGGSSPLRELRLAAGEQVELQVRLIVRGQAAGERRTHISFKSNDPDRPDGHIALVVPSIRAGLKAYPAGVVFGTVVVGQESRQTFDLYDDATPPRSVKRVSSSCPKLFTARFRAANEAERRRGDASRGTFLGSVEVSAQVAKPGPLNGEIEIELEGRASLISTVPVSGRVANEIELVPSEHSLPRASGNGPVYSARSICRSLTGKPYTITAVGLPKGVSVEVGPVDGDPSARMVEFRLDPAALAGRPTTIPVRFKARTEDRDLSVDVSIRVWAQGGAEP